MGENGKHAPARLRTYLEAHNTAMEHHIHGGFVVQNALTIEALGSGFMRIAGEIACIGDLYIDVDKRLQVSQSAGETFVHTVAYSYNCAVRRRGNVLRYDSPHAHRPMHHVHRYKFFGDNGDEGDVTEVSADGWPTLSEVIQQFHDWCYQNYEALTALGSL